MQPHLTRSIKILLISYFGLFIVERSLSQFAGVPIVPYVGLVPSLFVNNFMIWQIFTYGFFHGDPMHLFLNMLMLLFLGAELESIWGTKRFLKFFFFCQAFGGICYLFMQFFVNSIHTPMIGASAGIFGIFVAYGILFSDRTMLFMMIFPMKAKHMVMILAAIEFVSMVFGPNSNVSNVAHLGGMVGGFGYLWVAARMKFMSKKGEYSFFGSKSGKSGGGLGGILDKVKPGGKKKAGHLKLVKGKDDPDSDKGSSDGPTWH